MTIAALGAALAGVHVVRLVTGGAVPGRLLVAVAEVTGGAGELRVLFPEREGRLVVVVAQVAPGARVMTGAAVAPQPSLVRLLFLMAAEAVARRIAIGLAGRVAARAGEIGMGAAQPVVRQVVVELLRHELDDVAAATEMLAVAGVALRPGHAGQVPVEAPLAGNIRGDVLVTVEAKLCLPAAVATVVTLRALLLVLRVGRREFAGHQQRLWIHGGSPL